MKYVVSSQEKPQKFPIYSIHSDLDSFILYNADMCPKSDVKFLEATQTQGMDEQSGAQDQKFLHMIDATNENDIEHDFQEPNLPIIQDSKTLKASHGQEISW